MSSFHHLDFKLLYVDGKLKLPDQVNCKKMDYIGVVITLEGTLQGSTLLVDIGLSGIQILISDAYGDILAPVILDIYLPITISAGYQEFPHWMELADGSYW